MTKATGNTADGDLEKDSLAAELEERVLFLEGELQQKREELEAQNEELEVQLEELRCNNEELEKTTLSLQESEEKYRLLAEDINDCIWETDANDRISYISPRVYDLLKYRPEETIGKSPFEHAHPGSVERLKATYYTARRQKTPIAITINPYLARDGGTVYLQLSARPIFDNSGNVAGFRGVARDVTELVAAEEERARLAAIVVSSDDAITSKTLDGIVTSWNGAAERIYGYTAEEAIGKPIDIIVPGDRIAELREILDKIKHGQRIEHFETVRVTKSGRKIEMAISISPIIDSAGTVIGASTIARDITGSKQAEKAIKKSRAILAKSQQIAHVGNMALNLKTGRIFWSDEGFRIFGYAPGEIEPSFGLMLSMIHPGDRDILKRSTDAAISENKLYNLDLRIVMRDGSTRYANFVADRLKRDANGAPEWLYGILQDITARKSAEKELIEARQNAELYLDLMGHDISNIHQIILGQLELARDIMDTEGKLGAGDRETIDTSIEALNRSASLIDNVRKLQKLRSGEYRSELIDVSRMLGDVAKAYAGMADRSVAIDYMPADGCLVKANPLLKDVFTNLMDNAVKHSSGPVWVGVGVSKVSDNGTQFCKVTVEDNGNGIPDARKDDIFGRFHRGQTRAKGTGLGLYIVRTLIDSFGGRVKVEDRVPGDHTKGSRFSVYLPIAEEANARM